MNYKKLLPKRQQASHKGTFGKVLNIAGSTNFQGAAYLSSISALKVGAGYVTLFCPKNILHNIVSLSADITFLPLGESVLENISLIQSNLHRFDVVSLGSGLGLDKRVVFFVEKVIKILCDKNIPVIIDADGLNAISLLGITKLPKNSVITPHEAEMARLVGVSTEQVSSERLFFAEEASKKYNCIVVLKGHETIICNKGQDCIINKTGNSALAKAGSGDILTGMIAGFMAK